MNYTIQSAFDKQKIHQVIDQLSDQKKWSISIKIKREIRSLPQNRLYWLWLACICDETGGDRDEIHLELKRRFLPLKTVKGLSGEVTKPISTTELDTKQFTDYLEKIQIMMLRDYGITLPNPSDLIFSSFVENYQDFI